MLDNQGHKAMAVNVQKNPWPVRSCRQPGGRKSSIQPSHLPWPPTASLQSCAGERGQYLEGQEPWGHMLLLTSVSLRWQSAIITWPPHPAPSRCLWSALRLNGSGCSCGDKRMIDCGTVCHLYSLWNCKIQCPLNVRSWKCSIAVTDRC